MSKAIILSGGGAKGAWGVGVVKALMEQGQSYDIAIGTSTGSLMAPFILANDIQALEDGYTSVDQDSIFNKNPFSDNGDLKMFMAVGRLISGKKTLGESENLRNKIDELITDEIFQSIRDQNKLLGATVVNFNKGVSEVKTTSDYTDHQMKDWIWASANNPLFMSNFVFTEPNGETYSYADGGVTNYANVDYIIQNRPTALTEIDVIFHNTRGVIREGYNINNKVLARLMRVLDMFNGEIFKNDLRTGRLETQLLEDDVQLNIYYMNDHDITTITGPSRNTLLFDKQRMQTGVMRGYTAMNNGTIDKDACMIMCESGQIVPHLQP